MVVEVVVVSGTVVVVVEVVVVSGTVVVVVEVVVISGTVVVVVEVVVISGTVVSSISVSEFINTTNPEPITNDITKNKIYLLFIFSFNLNRKTDNQN